MADITLRFGDTNDPVILLYFFNDDDTPKDTSSITAFVEIRKSDKQVKNYGTNNTTPKIYFEGHALMWHPDAKEIDPGSYTYAIKIFENNKYITVIPDIDDNPLDGTILVKPEKVTIS